VRIKFQALRSKSVATLSSWQHDSRSDGGALYQVRLEVASSFEMCLSTPYSGNHYVLGRREQPKTLLLLRRHIARAGNRNLHPDFDYQEAMRICI
jgi:hypothetical protein